MNDTLDIKDQRHLVSRTQFKTSIEDEKATLIYWVPRHSQSFKSLNFNGTRN